MRRLSAASMLTALCGSIVFGQAVAIPARWSGTWALRLPESEMDHLWIPGAPNGLTIVSQSLGIATTSGRIKLTSDTVTSEMGPSNNRFDINLDGKETVSADGLRVSVKRIDDRSFDIIVRVNNERLGNHVEESHFVVSADGNKLTETKTDIQRDVVRSGGDQTQGAVMRNSTAVLVFYKIFVPKAGPTYLKNIQGSR